MITKDMKISKMLHDYPETMKVLLKASPHFNKLKNKLLRKALAPRVSIEQASAIAGVDLKSLLLKLNKKVNISGRTQIKIENTSNENSLPEELDEEFLRFIENKRIVELDVRPIIDAGKDPFADIIKKIKTLNGDEIFLLVNSFEPIPLYSVLAKRKFEYKTVRKENIFYVYFFNKNGSDNNYSNNYIEDGSNFDGYNDKGNIIEIDVREMVPPEPMIKILETLSKIDDKTILVVHHHREPLMLYPKLEERGYKAISNKIKENYFKVVIMKKELNHNE